MGCDTSCCQQKTVYLFFQSIYWLLECFVSFRLMEDMKSTDWYNILEEQLLHYYIDSHLYILTYIEQFVSSHFFVCLKVFEWTVMFVTLGMLYISLFFEPSSFTFILIWTHSCFYYTNYCHMVRNFQRRFQMYLVNQSILPYTTVYEMVHRLDMHQEFFNLESYFIDRQAETLIAMFSS